MTRLEKEKVLERIYYDVDEGFGSARDLYEKARKVDVGITLDMVSTWMRAQPNKQTRNYKNYNSYTAPFPKYEFQIDLMDVTSLLRDVGSEIKGQLRYGLICIDIFSKKCHIVSSRIKMVMTCLKQSWSVSRYWVSLYRFTATTKERWTARNCKHSLGRKE